MRTGEALDSVSRGFAVFGMATLGLGSPVNSGIRAMRASAKYTGLPILLKNVATRIESLPASAVNAKIMAAKPSMKPPYHPDFYVHTYRTTTAIEGKWVRVYSSNNSPSGPWIMDKASISGLSPKEIQTKFSLPSIPEFISDVQVPEGVLIRKGLINGKIFNGDPQKLTVQYEILGTLQDDWFQNLRGL